MDFLYFNPDIYIPISLIDEIKSVNDNELKQSIMSYAVISDDYKDREIYPIIDHKDWKMQIITIYSLIKYYGRVPYLDRTLDLKTKIPELLHIASLSDELFYIKQCLTISIMYRLHGYEDIIYQYLFDHNVNHRRVAIQVVPLTKDLNFLKKLISLEFDPQLFHDRISSIAAFDQILIDYISLRHHRINVNELVIIFKALAKLPTQQSANILLGFVVHSVRRVRMSAAENLSSLLSNHSDLIVIQEMINKRLVVEIQNAIKLAQMSHVLVQKQYFDKQIDGNSQNFWIHLRLGVMLDRQWILVSQLLKILNPDMNLDYLNINFNRRNNSKNEMALSNMKSIFNPEVYQHISDLTNIIHLSHIDSSKLKWGNNKIAFTNQLLKLQDKTITTLIDHD